VHLVYSVLTQLQYISFLANFFGLYKTIGKYVYIHTHKSVRTECAYLWLTLAWRWFCKNRNM